MSAATRRRCERCGFENGPSWSECFRCRRQLAGSPLVEVEPVAASWGDGRELERRSARIPCRTCGADTPQRYAFCVACGRPPNAAPTGHRRCPSCEAWGPLSHRFCARCGDPTGTTGEAGGWRPDGCPGCWADLPPNARHCGECGAPVRADLERLRERLRELCMRRVSGDYRVAERLPEMHPARPEAILREDDHAAWLSLDSSEGGACDLEVAISPDADAGPPATSSLLRLARYVRARLGRPDPEVEQARALLAAHVDAADERLDEVEPGGGALRVRLVFREVPTAPRMEAWAGVCAEAWRALTGAG